MADDTLNLAPTTVTGAQAPSDSDLLYALQLAHGRGDTAGAMKIAEMMASHPVTHEAMPGNTSGSPHEDAYHGDSMLKQAGKAYVNAVGSTVEPLLSMASGAVMQPLSGLAGLGAAATHAMGLTKTDPADVVRGVQNFGTYQPQTEGGKATQETIGDIAGLIPKGADWVGQQAADATGSPAVGAAVNTGLQGLGMVALPMIPKGLTALNRVPMVNRATNFLSDVAPGGGTRAANRLIQQYAGGPEESAQAAAALHQAGQSGALAEKYKMQPTVAGTAQNAGLAQMERTLRNQPENATKFNEVDSANRDRIHDLLSGISGTPEERLRATTARDYTARSAYDEALNNPEHFVQPPKPGMQTFDEAMDTAQGGVQAPGESAPAKPVNETVTGINLVGERLTEVLQRPAMESAMKNARMQAANRGIMLDDRNLMQQLHYAKMDLDGQISMASRSGDSTTLGGLMDTKHTLLGVMDDLSPAYANARKSFQTSSGPLNRMDVGQALKDRYINAIQEAAKTGSTPSGFMNALRLNEGDTMAQSATGFNGAKLRDILHPADMEALEAIKAQLGNKYFADTAGRSVGSPTAANLESQGSLNSVGNLPGVLGSNAGTISLALHHPALAIPAGFLGGMARASARRRLTDMALNPQKAIEGLTAHRGTLDTAFPTKLTGPMSVGANENANTDEQHFAEGGKPKPASTWDLIKTGWHELTDSDDTPPPPPQNTSGAQASGSKGVDFDRWVNRNVDAAS